MLTNKGALEDKFDEVKRALALGNLNARYECLLKLIYFRVLWGHKIGYRGNQTIVDLKLGSVHSKLDDFIRVVNLSKSFLHSCKEVGPTYCRSFGRVN